MFPDSNTQISVTRELSQVHQSGTPLRPLLLALFDPSPRPDEFLRFSMAAYRDLDVSDDVRLFMGRLWAEAFQIWNAQERAEFFALMVRDRHEIFSALDFSVEVFRHVQLTADEVFPWITAAYQMVGNDLCQQGFWSCVEAFCTTTPVQAIFVAERWLAQNPDPPSLTVIGNMIGCESALPPAILLPLR